jgi:hypothetical protein
MITLQQDTIYMGTAAPASGGGGSGTTDVPLTRISDDNGNEIGTAFMEFTDANGNKFKVVLLNEQYWSENLLWSSNTGTVTDMPVYGFPSRSFWYNAKETATENTQLILDWCSTNGYTSAACEYCRSQSFTIGGTVYYGQLPNMREVFDILRRFSDSINIFKLQLLSSTQYNSSKVWVTSNNIGWSGPYGDGTVTTANKTSIGSNFWFAISPVLEIPLS